MLEDGPVPNFGERRGRPFGVSWRHVTNSGERGHGGANHGNQKRWTVGEIACAEHAALVIGTGLKAVRADEGGRAALILVAVFPILLDLVDSAGDITGRILAEWRLSLITLPVFWIPSFLSSRCTGGAGAIRHEINCPHWHAQVRGVLFASEFLRTEASVSGASRQIPPLSQTSE